MPGRPCSNAPSPSHPQTAHATRISSLIVVIGPTSAQVTKQNDTALTQPICERSNPWKPIAAILPGQEIGLPANWEGHMISGFRIAKTAGIALVLFGTGLLLDAKLSVTQGTLSFGTSQAEARVGRPGTPYSVAGVARRTTRRAVRYHY